MAALGWVLNLGFAAGAATDSVPDQFTWTDLVDQATGTVISSNTITVSGMSTSATASFVEGGHLSGQYSLNSGAWTDLANVTINNGDTLQLRLTSSTTVGGVVTITVDIGGISDEWSVKSEYGVSITNATATTDVPTNYEICDRTGFRVPVGQLVKEWNGRMVRAQSWEPRHPQDFVRSREEQLKGSPRPEQDDQFIGTDIYPNEVSQDDL